MRAFVGARSTWFAAALLVASLVSSVADAQISFPFVGVAVVEHPGQAFLVVVDLCQSGVGVRATRYSERRATPEQWAAPLDLEVAINADFFEFPGWGFVEGRARGAGEDWPPGAQQQDNYAYWQFGPSFAGWMSADSAPPLPGVTDVVAGHDIIVQNGSPIPYGSDPGFWDGTHPRSAVGMSGDHRTLYLMTTRVGCSLNDLGPLMMQMVAEAGAPPVDYATNQDGGGSAQMYIKGRGQVVSTGRQVGNHLGIYAKGAGGPGSCTPFPTRANRADHNAASWAPGRLDFAVLGKKNEVFHRYWDNGPAAWGDWDSLGKALSTAPTVTSWGPGRLDYFGLGPDQAVMHKAWTGVAWTEWENLGGKLKTSPTVTSWGPNRIDMFGTAEDHTLTHRWWDGTTWQGWESLGGKLSTSPAVTSWASERLDIVALDEDGAVVHKFYDPNGWSDWENLEGPLVGTPAVVSPAPGQLHIFGVGKDKALWHGWWTGSAWSGWESLGGVLLSTPSIVAPSPSAIHVLAVGTDHAVWRRWWDGTAWRPWESLGGNIEPASLAVVGWGGWRIDIVGVGVDRALWHRGWSGLDWWPWESLGGYVAEDKSFEPKGGTKPGTETGNDENHGTPLGRDPDGRGGNVGGGCTVSASQAPNEAESLGWLALLAVGFARLRRSRFTNG